MDHRGVSVKDLYGARLLSPEAIQESMRPLEKRLSAQFEQRVRQREQLRQEMLKFRAPLVETLSKDNRVAEAIKGMRQLSTVARDREAQPPDGPNARERIFSGSIGATQVPPFDYQWTWYAVSGNPSHSESADANSGYMGFHIWTDHDNSSSMSAAVGVGIYFRPPTECANFMQVWSAPRFRDHWGDWCAFDGASADAWIGLYVASYDLNGAAAGVLVDQQVSLWNDSSWWTGVGVQDGSNSAFGLYAAPFLVDQQHYYAIWVWAGGDVSGAGWGGLTSGSAAGDDLVIAVPSITWELA